MEQYLSSTVERKPENRKRLGEQSEVVEGKILIKKKGKFGRWLSDAALVRTGLSHASS